MRRRKQETDDGGGDSWALSYGDMMTLLLTFFVLIVSFSTTELVKFRQAMGSLRGARGVLMEQDGNSIIQKSNSSPKIAERAIVLRMLQDLEKQIFDMNVEGAVDIEVHDNGVNFLIHNELLFDLGQTKLKPRMLLLLNKIGKMINNFSCEVRVEGHTDTYPIRTKAYPSNWELSAARAVAVVRYFAEELNIHPSRLQAVGLGEHRPVLPNDSEEHRQENRRVEIFLSWAGPNVNNI